jgi:esterase/lipase superfamily enzyme/outer membrane protein OmpA-like peptidoglycan-associated protein
LEKLMTEQLSLDEYFYQHHLHNFNRQIESVVNRLIRKVNVRTNLLLLLVLGTILSGCANRTAVFDPPPEQFVHPTITTISGGPTEMVKAANSLAVATNQLPEALRSTAYFGIGSFHLDEKTRTQLDDLISRNKTSSIKQSFQLVGITAHTDSVGSEAYNSKLSIRRAENIRNYLVQKGINPKIIRIEGRGEKQPVASNNDLIGRQQNNRVDIEAIFGNCLVGTNCSIQAQNRDVSILFATNRERTGSDNPYVFYSNRMPAPTVAQRLRRGLAVIHVPETHWRASEIKRPSLVMVTLERTSATPLARLLGVSTIKAADSRTQFSYAEEIEELTRNEFASELKTAVSKSKSKTAVLYVHGFANDFTDAVFRTAQITFDLSTDQYDFVPLMFSWPSDPGVIGAGYEEARKRSLASGYDLADFLAEIAANTDIGTVHLVAHSMGAEVLSTAMMKLGVADIGVKDKGGLEPLYRKIIFAAPDADPFLFENAIGAAIKTNHAITLYGAKTDLPLWLSSFKNREGPRVGSVSTASKLPGCVDKVDVTAVAQGLSHSTWAESKKVLEDLQLILRDGLDPLTRGLKKRRTSDRVIWTLSSAPQKTSIRTSVAKGSGASRNVSCSGR